MRTLVLLLLLCAGCPDDDGYTTKPIPPSDAGTVDAWLV